LTLREQHQLLSLWF